MTRIPSGNYMHVTINRQLAAWFTNRNPVLGINELGVEKTTGQAKLGNGVTPWNDLAYFGANPNPGDHEVLVTLVEQAEADHAELVDLRADFEALKTAFNAQPKFEKSATAPADASKIWVVTA